MQVYLYLLYLYKYNYIGCCNIALLKLLTVLFIVGCNNRKLYYIEMYCLLLVVTTGNYIILKVGSTGVPVVHSSIPVHRLQTAERMASGMVQKYVGEYIT